MGGSGLGRAKHRYTTISFSLGQFYEANRRLIIWLCLIALLWLLRDFFAHIFITFILIFVASPLTRLGQRWLKLPYRVSLALVYLWFVLMLAGFVRYVTPSVIGEASLFINNFSELQNKLLERKNDFSERYPGMVRPLHGYMRSVLDADVLVGVDDQMLVFRQQLGLSDQERVQYDPDDVELDAEAGIKLRRYYDREAELLTTALVSHASGKVRERLPGMLDYLYTGTATVLLALLFSFLILYDSVRLGGQIKNLEASRLRDFYREVAQPVIRFAYVVGRAIQAQAMIAVINTLLTFIGLLVLGLPSIALLSLIVFVCSFIPVLGVFISTTPMLLVAVNTDGLLLALGIILMITVIHVVEAYLLNPMIYGKHLKLNPVMVLIILVIAYHGFGLWGMILGIPVAHYFIHDVFGVPLWHEKRLAQKQGSDPL